jgi:hypothetical protein
MIMPAMRTRIVGNRRVLSFGHSAAAITQPAKPWNDRPVAAFNRPVEWICKNEVDKITTCP